MSVVERCRRTIDRYSAQERATLTSEQMHVQAIRASELVSRLRPERATAVLDDPVGTGKTVVALAAARELITAGHVRRVLVISPNSHTSDRWRERAHQAGLTVSTTGLAHKAVHVRTMRALDGFNTSQRASLLVIIDEAHRGLHRHTTQSFQSVQRVARGARILLVSATPFQLSAEGLVTMLTVGHGSQTEDHLVLHEQAHAAAALIRVEHEIDLGGAPSPDQLRREQSARHAFEVARHRARAAREAMFLPEYPREDMGLPAEFEVPPAQSVKPDAVWRRAYHVARLVPDLTLTTSDADRVHNTDAFMRELVSSGAALEASKAWQHFRKHAHRTKDGRRLFEELSTALLSDTHPKVAHTAELAIAHATQGAHGRHVLIFCYFTATPAEIQKAVEELAPHLQVEVARGAAQARASRLQGFRERTSRSNPPIVLVVGEALSESVDLDGGRPVVIHHDLSWSPVRFDQRMGRVVRASSGFQPVATQDVVIPVLAGGIDDRMYQTLQGRRRLARKALDWADDENTLDL